MFKTLFSFDYSAHERFIAPARETSEVWRLVLGLIMTMVIIFMRRL